MHDATQLWAKFKQTTYNATCLKRISAFSLSELARTTFQVRSGKPVFLKDVSIKGDVQGI